VPGNLRLEVHLFAGNEGVAALRATRAAWMKVIGLARLQHLASDVALAIDANDPKQPLVVALAVGLPVLGHVLAMEGGPALGALEAPDVPVPVERNERAAVLDLVGAAGANWLARARERGDGLVGSACSEAYEGDSGALRAFTCWRGAEAR